MYEVIVESSFTATHSVPLPDGGMEPVHAHEWRVWAHYVGDQLDPSGFLIDFLEVKSQLDQVAGRLNHRLLNEMTEFQTRLPSAENVAKHIFDRLDALDRGRGKLARVQVSEAAGCFAAFHRAAVGDVSPPRGRSSDVWQV